MAERFILFCGRNIKPWIYTDEPVTRGEAIKLIITKEVKDPPLIIAYDLEAGTSRNATKEIVEAAQSVMDPDPIDFDHHAAKWDHDRALRAEE